MVFCKDCGTGLDEGPDISAEDRIPCPSCGSLSRLFTIEVGGSISPSGRLVAQRDSTDGTEAIRVVDSQKRSSATDLGANGTLSYAITGSSPKGESDTLDVCKALIQRLNSDGGQWGEPLRPKGTEGGIDCLASDGQQDLNIQVTRAVSNQKPWRQLGKSGSVDKLITVAQAADDLLASAMAKARGVPRDQLSEIVLALDAMDTASHSLAAVVIEFRKRYGAKVRALGFKAIWVVGPLEKLVTRLDT